MKIVCFSDLHIGQKSYCKINPETGLHVRELNAVKILNKIVDTCIKEKVDVCIFAGDMFKNNLPNPTLIDKVNEAFIRLSKNNILTLVLDGNHDVSKQDSFCSGLHQFESLDIDNIIQTRFFKIVRKMIGGTTYQFVFLPTHHTQEDIASCMESISNDYPTLVIGHLTVKDAMFNDWLTVKEDECIDIDVFNKKNIIAVVLGHLHKYQVLNESPKVFYCGSADRIDFSEEKQDKGYVYLEVSDKIDKFEFRKLNVQKFITLKVNAENESDSDVITDLVIDKMSKRNLKDAIIRIKIKLSSKVKINEKKILEYAYHNDAMHVLKICYELPEVKNELVINNFLPVKDIISQYFHNNTRKKSCIKIACEIVDEVEGS